MFSKLADHIVSLTASKHKSPPFWKFEFDNDAYWKEFSYASLKKHVIIVMVLLLFSGYITDTIFAKTMEFITSNVNKSLFVNAIFYYVLSISIFVYFVKRIIDGYLPTFSSVITFIIYGYLYVILIRKNPDFSFLPLDEDFKYIDIIFIGTAILNSKWLLSFKRLATEGKNYQFITDAVDVPDLFGYKGLGKELNEFIHHTETNHSFAIGILGNWGDGKSFLANDILKHFEEFNDDYIIVDFNPWLYKKDQLVENFFNEFLSATASIDRSLKNDFASYITKITEQSGHEKIQLTNLVFKIMTDYRSIDEIKKKISQKIKLSGKKVIVFVDDTDRLDQSEIQEVLKIIRNCANFANTFFIAGIDYNYVDSKVGNPKYLEKIFNVLVALPKISPSTLKNEIQNKFKFYFPGDDGIKVAIDDLIQYDWFMSFIKNIRQLNRLINSFKIAYNKLRGNIDVTDLVILEVLKNSSTSTYFGIFNGEILKYDQMAYIATNNKYDAWIINLESIKNLDNKDYIQNALNHLVKREETKHMRSFSDGYELMYFNYAPIGIDIITFYETLEKKEQEIIFQFDEWLAKDGIYKSELLQLLTLYLERDPLVNYKIFIPILIQLNYPEFATRVFNDLYIQILNSDLEDNTIEKYINGLLNIMEDCKEKNPLASISWTSSITLTILRRKNEQSHNSISIEVEQKQIEKIYQSSLLELIKSNTSFDLIFEAFMKCVTGLKNNIYQYNNVNKNIFKKYIVENENNLNALLKATIVPKWNREYSENTRELIITDYLTIIFENKDELLKIIEPLESPEIKPLLNFLQKYINEYYEFRINGKNTFVKYVKDETLHQELLEYFN